jgi:predicted permease
MTTLLQDLRFGLRLFSRQPGFALVAILVLGVGIAANTTMFSLVNTLVLKPRPGAGESLVAVFSKHRVEPDTFRAFSYDNYTDLRARTDVFASLTAHNPAMVGITEGEVTRRAFIDVTTADMFETFDLPLLMGRTFTADEEKPGADIPVAVLSYPAWTKMGAPADVVGRAIRINQRDFTIVGIAPEGFAGTVVMFTPELWLPTGVYDSVVNDFTTDGLAGTLRDRGHHALIVYGRLREGLTAEAAAPMLDSISRGLEAAYPADNRDQHAVVGTLSRLGISTAPQADNVMPVLGVSLLAMSGIVLLIASLNLANMQLARASARRKEFAIRMSIGGSRARLVRQLLTESFLLSAAGGVVALMVSWVAMRALLGSMTGLVPVFLTMEPAPDMRVFLATLAFAAAGTVFSSLGPALSASRADVLPELKEQAGELPSTRARFATRHMLVMGQLALSLALVTTAGAFIRSAIVAAGVDPGFSFDRGIHANLDTGLAGYDRTRSMTTYEEVLDRIRQTPGITRASMGPLMPFGDIVESQNVQKPGPAIRPSDPDSTTDVVSAVAMGISDDYFPSLGLTLVRGRDFTRAEVFSTGGTPVAIIDQALATRIFGQEDPIGRQLQLNRRSDIAPDIVEIVGLAPAILHQMDDDEPGPHLYRPYSQGFRSGVYLHLSTANAGGEAALLPALRHLLRAVDPQLPVIALETGPMYRERNAMLWVVRAGATLFTIFGAVALFMATLGIYGVKSYLVSRRTREIGIRMALGATTRDVVTLVVRDGLALTAAGLVAGLGVSFLAVQGIGNLLFGGGGFDLPIVAGAFVALTMAALAANWVPARRATRVAPTVAFRN